MHDYISKTKLQIGLGSIFTAVLAVAGVMSYAASIVRYQSGDTDFTTNIVMFPCMLAFMLSGFIVMVSKKIKILEKICMESISLEDESKLSSFLDVISIEKRIPLLTVFAILLLNGVVIPGVMSHMLNDSIYAITLFSLSMLISTIVSIFIVKNEIAYLLKK